MKIIRISVIATLLVLAMQITRAQYPPAAGQAGSTAIRNDSSILVAWATHCEVIRGPMDISLPGGGNASFGEPEQATGFAEGNPSLVVSLGDGGSALLTFDGKIYNGPGPDFAVFENSFSDDFLELAFVEVSSNGTDFFRFPSVSLTNNATQVGTFGTIDPTKIHNLAGKYRGGYGTPFDLEELRDTPGLDVNAVTHIRIIDVVGCIQPPYASLDSEGHIINDPWPTPFPSGGFDLDGIGVIHLSANGFPNKTCGISAFYNPVGRYISFTQPVTGILKAQVFSLTGQLLASYSGEQGKIYLTNLPRGIYLVKIISDLNAQTLKIVAN